MNLHHEYAKLVTRRHFLRRCQVGLGSMALASLAGKAALGNAAGASGADIASVTHPLAPKPPHFAPKAKSVIYLHMSGGPPQHDLFDYKPKLVQYNGTPCPKEFTKGERFPFIKGEPKLLGTPHKFKQYGKSGALVSDILPHFQTCVDDCAIIRSMWTNQFNHAPAEMLLYTGSERAGQASMGSWITYGLGSENQDLPGFVVLVSGGTDPTGGKALWSSGFLPSVFQGVQCRTKGEPILYVSDPKGMSREDRRRSLDALNRLNELEMKTFGDPETLTRISQYELAYRMQIAVPDVMDISKEPQAVHDAYGTKPGESAFANNVLLARRLVERGVQIGSASWRE